MSRAWMPLYVADYLADTGHLSAAEHGAYLLLIMHYWQNGGLPNEDRRLARIARMSPAEWEDSRDVLFDLFDDGWTHGRIEAELKAAQEISEKAKDKAEKRWSKTRGNAAAHANEYAGADAAALPGHVPETCQSQPQSHTPPDTNVSGGVAPKAQPEHVQILGCLKTVLSEDRAKAVIDHRRKLKKPLTLHATNLLVAQFCQIADPNKAADLMILRGWQGCEPEWCVNAGLKLAMPEPQAASSQSQIFVAIHSPEWIAWEAASPDKLKPIETQRHGLGRYFPSRFPPTTTIPRKEVA